MRAGRRKSRDTVSMNLFPFMAVLICTMGSLIMLLVVMVQQARARATEVPSATEKMARGQEVHQIQRRQEQHLLQHEARKQLAEQAQQEVDGLKWQTEMLRHSYEQTTQQLAEQRLTLSHLEAHTRQLSEQASVMQAEADMIATAATEKTDSFTGTEGNIRRIKEQLDSATRELDAAQDQLENRPTKYAIVPYEGPNATNRPPIYIECLSDRVVLQPEGVVLVGEDFREPLTIENPLALALRAKREYLLEHGILDSQAEPYPLLIVRPGAAASYSAARVAMKAWDAEFGYELVESDIELDYRAADPNLTQLLSDIIIEARGKRRMMRSALADRASRRELLRPSASGGFEAIQPRSLGNTNRRRGAATDRFGSGAEPSTRSGTRGALGSPTDFKSASRVATRAGQAATAPDAAVARSAGSETEGSSSPPTPFSGSDRPPAQASAANDQHRSSHVAGSALGDGPGGLADASAANAPSSATSSASSFGTAPSLAESRGANWALPNIQPQAVGIRRPINVLCESNRLVLVPETGTRQELQIFRHSGRVSGVVDPFADAVGQRVDSWGIAGQGFYWRPILQIRVRGDGQTSYQQLLRLLEDSGIEVTRAP